MSDTAKAGIVRMVLNAIIFASNKRVAPKVESVSKITKQKSSGVVAR